MKNIFKINSIICCALLLLCGTRCAAEPKSAAVVGDGKTGMLGNTAVGGGLFALHLQKAADGGYEIALPEYSARIGSDGMLASFKVRGTVIFEFYRPAAATYSAATATLVVGSNPPRYRLPLGRGVTTLMSKYHIKVQNQPSSTAQFKID